jgi:segregation and condensation protein A
MPIEDDPIPGPGKPGTEPPLAAEPAAAPVLEAAAPPIESRALPEEGYQIRLGVFEGPLDLLLFLIKKKKIDIQDIPIAVITREYLEYLSLKERINLDREAEFLLMAALLIYIKSQILLPREQPVEPDIDPRKELVDRLADFQRIKAAVGVLREREEEQSQIWRRAALTAPLPEADLDLIEVSLFDLAESFFTMMQRKQGGDLKVIQGKELSMDDKMDEIVAILKERDFIDFLEYLGSHDSLEEALLAFFCLLELIKARLVVAIQEQLFHTIKVWLRKEAPPAKVNE